jgi:peptide subunit release factor 1 (eRF1)
MLLESDLRDLLCFVSPEPVLSIFLNTDLVVGTSETYKLHLRNMLKQVHLPPDEELVEQYFAQEYDWSAKSVALFSSVPQQYFRVFPLAVPVRDWVHVGERPSAKQLVDLFDTYGGYGVTLIDKQSARLFLFHMGELQEQESINGEEVKHTKRGGASSVHGQRGGVAGQTQREQQIVERNMKQTAEIAVRFFEEKHIRRVLIGGTESNTALFRSMLPKSWQSLVVETFTISMTASHADVLAHAMQIGRNAELHREAHIAENLLAAASPKGSGAIFGLQETINAINEERVRTLVLSEELHQPGHYCKVCGLLSLAPEALCPRCNNSMEQTTDIIELCTNAVINKGGEVEILHTSSPIENIGSIGAMLRY